MLEKKYLHIHILLSQFMRDKTASIAMLTGLLAVGSAFTFYMPIITRNIADGAINGYAAELICDLALFMLMGVGAVIVGYGSNLLIVEIGIALSYRLRKSVLNKALSHWHDDITTGDLITRVSGDCQSITHFIVGTVPNVLMNATALIVSICLLFWFDWVFGVTALLSFPVLYYVTKSQSIKIAKSSSIEREKDGLIMHFVQYVMNSFPVIIGARMQNAIYEKYDRNLIEYNTVSMDVNKRKIGGQSLLSLLNTLHNCVFFCLGVAFVANGRFSIGTFVAISSLSSKIISQAGFFARVPLQWAHTSVSLDRIVYILEKENHKLITAPADRNILLTADGLSMRGGGAFSLHCERGDVIGIKGQTGSGKTTLALKIAGLLSTDIQLSIHGISHDDIMYVPIARGMCPALSLRENIHSSCSDSILDQMLAAVGMEERWHISGLGYDDDLTEFCNHLSSGEQQRLAIGRALVRKPILLILDEAISNIDALGSGSILKSLTDNLLPKGAIVIISHRECDFALCNKVIDMPSKEPLSFTADS